MDRHERLHPDRTEHGHGRRARPGLLRIAVLLVTPPEEVAHDGGPLDAEQPREPGQVGETVGDAPGKRDVDPHPALGQRLEIGARVLFLVGEDQLGLEANDVVDPGVLGAADAGNRRDEIRREVAVVRPADQGSPAAESGHVEGVARHQRDDARQGSRDLDHPLAVVDHASRRAHRHSSSSSTSEAGGGAGGPPSACEPMRAAQWAHARSSHACLVFARQAMIGSPSPSARRSRMRLHPRRHSSRAHPGARAPQA